MLWGYALAFGPDANLLGRFHGLIGGLQWLGLQGVGTAPYKPYGEHVPHLAYMVFQMMFAVITPALISGGFAERKHFKAFVLFTLAWATLVYDPVAHWVWGQGGWLNKLGTLDFAGGTVVHITSGVSALVAAMILGRRMGITPEKASEPHDMTMVVLGAAAGAVAGLVAITPASGYVTPLGAILIGFGAGIVCYAAIQLRERIKRIDDALDVWAVHGVGGTWGALATGLFATVAVNANGANGLFNGNGHQLVVQAIAVAVSWVYSGTMTFLILKAINRFVPLRVSEHEEALGLDVSQHAEVAYQV